MERAAKFKQVNHSVTKIDALQLALGKDSYVADFVPRGALIIKMLWSPHAHAIIKAIDVSIAEKMPGVKAVLWYGNVPRIAHCTAGQGFPMADMFPEKRLYDPVFETVKRNHRHARIDRQQRQRGREAPLK